MRRIIQLTLALALGLAAATSALAADGASVRALLITASKAKGASDPQLAPYVATLKKLTAFDTFKFSGQGNASISAGGGSATVSLPGGHKVQLSDGTREGGGIKVRVEWTRGGEVMINTSLVLNPGVPAVLGRGGDGEVPVVLLIAK